MMIEKNQVDSVTHNDGKYLGFDEVCGIFNIT